MKQWKLWLIPLAIVLVVFLVKTIGVNGSAEIQVPVDTAQSVFAQEVQSMDREKALIMNGSAAPFEKAVVTARVAGIVKTILVENGQKMQAGQALVILENDPYQTAVQVNEALLAKAETQLDVTQANLERVEILYAGGAVSDKDYQDLTAALDIAKADVKTASAALANARRDLQNTTITAPITGMVVNCNYRYR